MEDWENMKTLVPVPRNVEVERSPSEEDVCHQLTTLEVLVTNVQKIAKKPQKIVTPMHVLLIALIQEDVLVVRSLA